MMPPAMAPTKRVVSLLFCAVVLYTGPVFAYACVLVRLHVPPGCVVGCPIVVCVLLGCGCEESMMHLLKCKHIKVQTVLENGTEIHT